MLEIWWCLSCGLANILKAGSREAKSPHCATQRGKCHCCGDWLMVERPVMREANKSHTALCSVYRDNQSWLAQ